MLSQELQSRPFGEIHSNDMVNREYPRQSDKNNKDSVNTSIGNAKSVNKVQTTANQRMSTCSQKTKFIWKPEIKKAAPILKHKKVVQTLRNITQNLKNQLKHSNVPIHVNTKQKLVESAKNKAQVMQQKNKYEMQPENFNLRVQQTDMKPLNIQKSPEKQSNLNNQRPLEHVILYSKYKGAMEVFPVYQDSMLSNKKQLRNLTISRQFDNDVDSDEEQIQMGVGFMYEQLMFSCQKHSQMKKRQSDSINSKSNLKGLQKGKDKAPLDKVKQKLVFR